MRPYLKKRLSQKKRAGEVVQSVGPKFKSQYHKKRKKMIIIVPAHVLSRVFN
jgi:hypothetical protein